MKISNDIYLKMIEDVEDYAILLLDKEGNIASWNKGAEKIKGYKPQEIIGKNFRVFYTQEEQELQLPEQLIKEAAANGKAIYEGWRIRKNGTKFWGNIVITALFEGDKKNVIGFTKVTRDLTEKKQAEEKLLHFNQELEIQLAKKTKELYKIENRFRLVVESAPHAMVLVNGKGKITLVNRQTELLFGYTREELIGKEVELLIPSQYKEKHPTHRHTYFANPSARTMGAGRDLFAKRKDGSEFPVEIGLNPMETGEGMMVLAAIIDITERKNAEEKILIANRLYAFVSAINQTIVHVSDEQTLYNEACRIAIEIGKFELSWISILDKDNKKIRLTAHCKATPADLEALSNATYADGDATANVLQSGKHHVINNYENEPPDNRVRKFAESRGFKSSIAMPIMKSGEITALYYLFSTQSNLFDEQEIRVLEEMRGDISFALDIFEKEKYRTQVEDRILHSEQRLKQAQAIAHVGSWEYNFSTGIVLWSDEACRIYGFPPEENIQSYQSWASYIHPDDLDYVMKITKTAEEALSSSAFHHRIIRKDGTVRQLFSEAHFEFNKVGKPTGLYGVAHDITSMKEAEMAFGQSQANLTLIMDLIPQSVFAKDYNGKFIFVNKSFANLHGLTPKEMTGKSIKETIPVKGEVDFILNQDREVISSGETMIIPEMTFTDYKGNLRLLQTVKVPFTVAGTNEKAVLGVVVDITEQKQEEVERAKIVADIVQRNKDLEQFSYIVSHNLRAPVANIMGIAEVVTLPGLSRKDEKEFMENLSVCVKKLDDVILDLNYILQVKQGMNEQTESVKFSRLLSDIILSIDNIIRMENVVIKSDFTAVDEMTTIKSYIYSIFYNLISNSIKYRRLGVQPIIEISSGKHDGKTELIFKDNGLGIDLKKEGDKVFGLYKRFHTSVEGKGMGLFMVKTQVQTLGGTIDIISEVNKGTEFRIQF